MRGIAPTLLLSQVESTAGWALAAHEGEEWREILVRAPTLEATWTRPEGLLDRLATMLAAHFTTVGTFVPTDVDAQIRHHVWQELLDAESLRAAVAIVDRATRWDPRVVSARVNETAAGSVSGHDGEWLAVRAGALGRALQLGVADVVESLVAAIDAELTREASVFSSAARTSEVSALKLATTLAHNIGDLSRVVEEWPARGAEVESLRARLSKLGHERSERHGGAFHLAGHVNKEVMATENHRFLALRRPRGLRRARALLLPIGPFFDRWGEALAKSELLERADRAEVLAALLHGHESAPTQLGYLRAIAGLHGAHAGGVESLADELPARVRKLVTFGPVREAMRLSEERFLARMSKRLQLAVGSYRK